MFLVRMIIKGGVIEKIKTDGLIKESNS